MTKTVDQLLDALRKVPRCSNLQKTTNVIEAILTFVEYWQREYKRQGFTENAASDLLDVFASYVQGMVLDESDFLKNECRDPLLFLLSCPCLDNKGIERVPAFVRWLRAPTNNEYSDCLFRLCRCAAKLGPAKSVIQERENEEFRKKYVGWANNLKWLDTGKPATTIERHVCMFVDVERQRNGHRPDSWELWNPLYQELVNLPYITRLRELRSNREALKSWCEKVCPLSLAREGLDMLQGKCAIPKRAPGLLDPPE